MALITAAAREELIALYVSMFNAAPGANNLSDMVRAVENGASGASVAATLAASANFSAVYPGFLTGQEFADRLVANMLGSEVVQSAKDWATNWVLTSLNAGKSRSMIIMEAVQALRATSHTAWTNAKALLANKVDVATYYSVTKELSSTNLSNLQAVLNGVTSAAASVTAAKAAVDGTAQNQAGQTFTLTGAIDTIDGTTGSDTILGDAATAGGADTINGGNGTDTLKLFGTGTIGNLTSIEALEINNFVGTAGTTVLNTSSLSGITNVSLRNTDLSDSVTHTIASTQTYTLNEVDDVDNDNDVLTITGSGSTFVMNLIGAGNAAPLQPDLNISINSNATTALTLNGTTTASNITIGNGVGTIKTLNIAGDAAVTVGSGSAINANVTTVNITNTAGATVTNSAATTTGLTITGVGGNDSVTLAQANAVGALSATTKVDLGAGNDTLAITLLQADDRINTSASFKGGDGTDTLNLRYGGLLTANSGPLFSGFETLSLSGGQGTYELTHLAANNTIGTINLGLTGIAAAITLNNVPEATAVSLNNTTTFGITLNQKDAGAGSPDDVMNVTVAGSVFAATTGRTIASVDVNDVETVNLTSTGIASVVDYANTISVLAADEATKVTANASTAELVISDVALKALVLFDATASVRDVSVTTGAEAFLPTAGVAFRGGAGDDVFDLAGADTGAAAATDLDFVVTGGAGKDDITLPASGTGVDHIVYAAVGESLAGSFDEVTNFDATAEDKLVIKAFGFTGSSDDQVMTATGVTLSTADVIEVSSTVNFFDQSGVDRAVAKWDDGSGNTFVFVDANKNGDFDATTDLVIQLVGVAVGDFENTDIIYA